MHHYFYGLEGCYIAPTEGPLCQAQSLCLQHANGVYWAQHQEQGWFIEANTLVNMGPIAQVHLVCELNGEQHPLDALTLLQPFDVDTIELARKRIASNARPIKDAALLRMCCKRAVQLHFDNFEILGLCLCPVAYRILDLQQSNDPDLPWFNAHAQRLLSWRDVVKPPAYARWSNSVLMAKAYLHIHQGQMEQAEAAMHRILEFAAMIPYASLTQTNLVRSGFLLADFYLEHNERKLAQLMLTRVLEYASAGIVHSDFLGPDNGYMKFSEVEVTLRGAKYAKKALAMLANNAPLEHIQRAYNLIDLGGYTSIFAKRKRDQALALKKGATQ